MANFQSVQYANKMPIPSHGSASNLKAVHFQVALAVAGANTDTLELGYLPDYAVPVKVTLHSTAAVAGVDIGYVSDPDGLVDGLAVVADIPVQSGVAAAQIFRNVGLGKRKVIGVFTGVAAIGTFNVLVEYIVEDPGVAYPYRAAT